MKSNGIAIGFVKFIFGIGVIMGILAYCIGPPLTAAFAGTAATVVGQGTGITIGSLPKFAQGIQSGQAAVNPEKPEAEPDN